MSNNQLATINEATKVIEEAIAKCNAKALAVMPALTQAVTLATGIQQLRSAMSDQVVQSVFMPLQGTALGFVTDKDSSGGYPASVIRDCMIEAMLKGLRPINNEINIIAGRCYAAKNGLERLVKEWPGLTDLHLVPGVPQIVGEKGALVSMRATWRLDGKQMELVRDVEKRADGTTGDTRIVIRVNNGMGADAIIGKAMRKTFKAILEMISGSSMSFDDGDVIETRGETIVEGTPPPVVPAEQEGRRIKMGGNGARKQDPADVDPDTGEVRA